MTEQPNDPTIGIIDPHIMFLTIEEAAAVYHVSPDTMRRICRSQPPKFHAKRISKRGEWRIYRPSFVQWLLSDDHSPADAVAPAPPNVIDLASAGVRR